ncbi:hypothetical protein FRX31_017860 [Thalictrum thalictroides]|uniref:Uncharacterized protein n=1 Tax=Thalictrum thalictroides TaxID=46969 RepID=A0A7J6W5A5_THATH|nr:hypothetical protein FRX31_017860 [Thalictrum thalictroides]
MGKTEIDLRGVKEADEEKWRITLIGGQRTGCGCGGRGPAGGKSPPIVSPVVSVGVAVLGRRAMVNVKFPDCPPGFDLGQGPSKESQSKAFDPSTAPPVFVTVLSPNKFEALQNQAEPD